MRRRLGSRRKIGNWRFGNSRVSTFRRSLLRGSQAASRGTMIELEMGSLIYRAVDPLRIIPLNDKTNHTGRLSVSGHGRPFFVLLQPPRLSFSHRSDTKARPRNPHSADYGTSTVSCTARNKSNPSKPKESPQTCQRQLRPDFISG